MCWEAYTVHTTISGKQGIRCLTRETVFWGPSQPSHPAKATCLLSREKQASLFSLKHLPLIHDHQGRGQISNTHVFAPPMTVKLSHHIWNSFPPKSVLSQHTPSTISLPHAPEPDSLRKNCLYSRAHIPVLLTKQEILP